MKKLIIVYVVLIAALILLVLVKSGGNLFGFLPSFGTSASAEINGKKYNLLVAKSEKDRQKGLSGRKSLDKNQGMIFIFDAPGRYTFWMKDMNFPLDIIYINNNKVVDLFHNLPPVKESNVSCVIQTSSIKKVPCYTPKNSANYVLELNAGESEKNKIQEGTTIKLTGVK